MPTRAHERVLPFHLLVDAFALERFLPYLAILDFELGDLVVVDKFVLVLAAFVATIILSSVALAFLPPYLPLLLGLFSFPIGSTTAFFRKLGGSFMLKRYRRIDM